MTTKDLQLLGVETMVALALIQNRKNAGHASSLPLKRK